MTNEVKVGDTVDGWEVVSVYTTEQAEADGVIVRVATLKPLGVAVYFTDTLMGQGYKGDPFKRLKLIEQGIGLLQKDEPEDSPYMRLRVIEQDKIWVVQEYRRLTFMAPSDY